jgi:hypothetical protein
VQLAESCSSSTILRTSSTQLQFASCVFGYAGWSDVFQQEYAPTGRPLTFAVFGDAGLVNFVSLDQLVSDAANGAIDYVLHVGDAGEPMAANPSKIRCPPSLRIRFDSPVLLFFSTQLTTWTTATARLGMHG